MTTLLIVDHVLGDSAGQEFYRKLFVDPEYSLQICDNGKQALQRLQKDQASIDGALILFELSGEPTGAELLSDMSHEYSKIPRILLTRRTDLHRIVIFARQNGERDLINLARLDENLHARIQKALTEPDQHPRFDELRKRPELIGEAPAFLRMLRETANAIDARDSKQLPAHVLLRGDTGTGKELLARAIHALGPAGRVPWVAINIAGISSTLAESTLFGHIKGAFTGATDSRPGLFELCEDGVLFLDEFGDIPDEVQNKILRVLSEREFQRVGEPSVTRAFRGRVIAAAQPLRLNATVREDLHLYRFRTISLPRLCERRADLWLLAEYFREKYASGRSIKWLPETRDILERHSFPGNVRELENTVAETLAHCSHELIGPTDLRMTLMDSGEARVAHADPGVATTPMAAADSDHRLENALESAGFLTLPQNYNRNIDALVERWKECLAQRVKTAVGTEHGSVQKAMDLLGITRKTAEAVLKRNRSNCKGSRPDVATVTANLQAKMQAGLTDKDLDAITGELLKMSVADINAVKKSLGLKASGTKAALAKKVAERAINAATGKQASN